MDGVELPLPAAIVTKIMRSSGCSVGGGGVTRVELLGSKSERETCSNSFHLEKDDIRTVNGSKPAFWNKMSEADLFSPAGQLSSLRNEEAFVDHDMTSVPEAKQSQRKSGKASRSNGNSSRRSRASHMEASLNDVTDLPKDLGSYPAKCNIAEKTQTSRKRSEKRNGKLHKSKSDSFSVKAGLSSFSSAAGGNSILGVYGSKHDICDFEKHVDEVSLKELLDGSAKCPKSTKNNEKKTEIINGSILLSVRNACSILNLQKPTQTLNVGPPVDATCNHNDDNKGDNAPDPFSCNKVEGYCSDNNANVLQFPLLAPKDVLDRLALPPPKDLNLMLLGSMKSASTSKVQNGGSLPTFPWSHLSGGHFKANPDLVKSTLSKSSCQGRWIKMGKSTTSLGDTTTSYLADFPSLTYNHNLVPLASQQPGLIEKEKSPLISSTNTTSDRGVTPSGTCTTASKSPAGHSTVVLAAAQILCDIASRSRKQKKATRASKLTSDEKLEKALFAIPGSRLVGPPTNHINGPDDAKTHTQKKLKLPVNEKDLGKGHFHWSTGTPQSSRSSPSKHFKNTTTEAKHHESTTSSSSSPLKRSITSPPARLPNKPPKLRKLVPMEWKNTKGNGKY